MIIDFNIFKQMKGTDNNIKGLLYILEQTPDRVTFHDISNHIRTVIKNLIY